jgi:3-hydroxyacyl-CoA dehydrogenase/enoyl-CoA hydratase/3-hydroxybutyryl-CoA epimerase/3-hydroxyacyl-CoA dehydrogenase/enoyl-CoA hydratase/3-hydroxybutyryl-CoA epimerase/enoyl-CoA isomerase
MPAATTLSLAFPDPDPAQAHVRRLRAANLQTQGVATEVRPAPIRSVGVVGAGIMGISLAAVNLKHGIPVAVTDAAPDALERAVPLILDEAAWDPASQASDPGRIPAFAPLLRHGTADSVLAGCDLVIESVVENMAVKQRVFERLERQLGADTWFTSNTSTLPITRLGEAFQRPERFCGLHLFNPVRCMPLAEVVRGRRTSDQTIATVVTYLKSVGKMPIVVGDGPGFLVNRLLSPYLNEALVLLCEGVPIEQIDQAALAFGMPWGPLALYDLIGIDTAFYGGRTMWEAFGDRIAVTPILPALLKTGRLGRKSGRGFYRYDDPQQQGSADPGVAGLLEPYIRRREPPDQNELVARLILPVLLEATRALSAGLVRDVGDVDLGMIFGLGFPEARGGLLYWADTLGAAAIVQMLKPFAPAGIRYQPTDLLLAMAREQRTFYPRP